MTSTPDARTAIEAGHTALGIELGSTRIKAVLVDHAHNVLSTGSSAWENQLVDGRWSYSMEAVRQGLQDAYASLVGEVEARHGVTPTTYGALGISAMMHGYLAFDAAGELLVPFRTWRNVSTGPAAHELSQLLDVNIPQRWSIAHLHQAILDAEPHVGEVASLTTLAGHVHRMLTGRHVLGVGDASGMFPVDSVAMDWDRRRVAAYDALIADRGFDWKLGDLLPEVLVAGQDAGRLTAEGAHLLDPTGTLQPGVPMCPPEGDAGTGMVATNAVAPRTGNVSAGTSIFAMVVLAKAIEGLHEEIDPVTTPDGSPVAMVHSNNGASELDAWVGMFAEFASLAGLEIPVGRVYDLLYQHAMTGEADGGGVLAYNLLSGEPVIGLEVGRPLITHAPDAHLSLASTTRAQLNAVFAPLRAGMDVLTREGVSLERLLAHGGIFKTEGVAQKVLADALRTSVAVGATAGEGGAWGIAVLARFASVVAHEGEAAPSLPEYLDRVVFADASTSVVDPDPDDAAAFEVFLDRYLAGLDAVRAASTAI
ncbi:ATPase [Schaalia sp. 19OD2882]|uniref:xylulokinase n=1 Tax=Schaalia sp. 19OD2882 TaxID=2794089 RepID=UPI001C1ECC8A|nr:FGGY-family carbohydrate kinase [Schaalia sp. 19OD2882]QWW19560.1 ATPase [Schaalia sp. 19OD2882]